jgi:thiol-disulfide isomerase/thioredoxin
MTLRSVTRAALALTLVIVGCLPGCGGAPQHGEMSALTANVGDPNDLCEHRVPADACVRCHPDLAERFKSVNDWCGPHDVPESQCHACHPNLTFEPLPDVPADADLRDVSSEEALGGLHSIVAQGKTTVIDFWATWCVPCRATAADLNRRLGTDPALAVRKIEVRDWDDPLAVRYLGGTVQLPLLVVFDAEGREVGRVKGHDPRALDALIAKARE